MNDINFNCPHCGESLAVEAATAGATVACPKCGQTILVPLLARRAQPSRGKGGLLAVLVVVALLLVAAGLLLLQRHGSPSAISASAPVSVPVMPGNLSTDLVFYFNSDSEPPAGKIHDSSGHGNDGQTTAVKWVVDGNRGGALVLSPTNSHIRVSNNESLNPSQFTLYAWIKTFRADHYWRRIFDKGLFHHDFALSVSGDWNKYKEPTKYRGFIEFEMPKSRGTRSRNSVADGQWHQIVGTYDGQDLRLYVDGQFQDKAHSSSGSLGSDLDLVIGGFTDPDPKYDDPDASFDGSLGDVMMFNRVLSPDEIAALYNSQKPESDAAQ